MKLDSGLRRKDDFDGLGLDVLGNCGGLGYRESIGFEAFDVKIQLASDGGSKLDSGLRRNDEGVGFCRNDNELWTELNRH